MNPTNKCIACSRRWTIDSLRAEFPDLDDRAIRAACPWCGATVASIRETRRTIEQAWWTEARVKATVTKAECSAECRLATNDVCRCSCGGANHGMGPTRHVAAA